MNDGVPNCWACPAIRRICFWGELTPYRPWERPVLFLIGLGLFAGAGYFLLFTDEAQRSTVVRVLWPLLGVFGLLGAAIAIFGCDRCVVRMWGDV